MYDLIGKVIDNYKILSVIGQGGMGVVYKALDIPLDKLVVLKMINPQLIQDNNSLRRFKEEPRLQAKLESPYIVHVYAFRETDFGMFIVMEYVEGDTLAEQIRRCGPLPWHKALPLFKKMLLAIEHAHSAGIIHRDVKPGNVLLSKRGEVKVTDFGLAKFQAEGDTTVTLSVAGTVNYMSPEQVQGLRNVDHRSDIYSLGVTLYEMLTGRLPFKKENTEYNVLKAIVENIFPPPAQFNSEIPQILSDIVMKAIEKNPNNRFQRAIGMLKSLEKFERSVYQDSSATRRLSIAPNNASSPPAAAVSSPNSQLKKRLLIGITGLLLAGVLYGAFLIYLNTGITTHAMLSVITIPSGAEIFINNKKFGKTPLLNERFPDGSYSIELRLDGYKSWKTKNISLQSGEKYRFEETLEALPENHFVRIRSEPPGASVYIDGIRVGETPFKAGSKFSGTHFIQIKREGYSPWKKKLNLTLDKGNTIQADLEPAVTLKNAELVLEVIPPGGIVLDNSQTIPDSSSIVTVPVSNGRHTVKFIHPQYGEKDFTVTVGAGERKSISYYFEQYVNIQALNEAGESIWATIVINGRSIDEPTPRSRLPLGPGTYRFTVHRLDYEVIDGDTTIVVEAAPEEIVHTLVFTLRKL